MFRLFWSAVNPWPAALHPRAPPRMQRHLMEAIANVCIFDIISLVYVPLACFENAIYAETLSPKSPLVPEAAGFFLWANFTEPVLQDENELSQYRSHLDDPGMARCTLPVYVAGGHTSPGTRGCGGERGLCRRGGDKQGAREPLQFAGAKSWRR